MASFTTGLATPWIGMGLVLSVIKHHKGRFVFYLVTPIVVQTWVVPNPIQRQGRIFRPDLIPPSHFACDPNVQLRLLPILAAIRSRRKSLIRNVRFEVSVPGSLSNIQESRAVWFE